MKKILTAIVLFVFVALPMSVMAMSTMGDSDLSTVTGQAGVSIGADITMNVSFGTVAWGDSDTTGITGQTGGGWVGLRNGYVDNMRIHMRSDNGMMDNDIAFGFYSDPSFLAGGKSKASFLADVAELNPDLTEQKALLASILGTQQLLTIDVYSVGNQTKVRIGVPTFEIDMAAFTAEVGLWTNAAANMATVTDHPDFTNFQKMGNIAVSNMVALLGKYNYIDIGAEPVTGDNTSGVVINVGNSKGTGGKGISDTYNMVDVFTLDYAAWGDDDGLGHTATGTSLQGWVGLTNMRVDAIKVAANLNINVCTPSGTLKPGLINMDQNDFAAFTAALPGKLASNDRDVKDLVGYLLNKSSIIGGTSVDIALDADIRVGQFFANAALGSSAANLMTASTSQNLLGSMYMSDLRVQIPTYTGTPVLGHANGPVAASWVTISAH